MEFDEKELRKEISYAIKNIHGVRQVETTCKTCRSFPVCQLFPRLCPFSFIKTGTLLSSGVHVCPVFHVCVKSVGSSVCFCFLSSVTSLFLFSLAGLRVSLFVRPQVFLSLLLSVCLFTSSFLCVPVSLFLCLSPPSAPHLSCSLSPCLSCLYVLQDRPVHPRPGV